jgi:hypothetical protein
LRDRLGQRSKHVVRPAIEDDHPEHGQGIRSSLLLIGVCWATGRAELQLEDEIRLLWVGNQGVRVPSLEAGIKLVIGAIRPVAEGMGKEAAVCSGVRDKDLLCASKRQRRGGGGRSLLPDRSAEVESIAMYATPRPIRRTVLKTVGS